MAWKSALAEVWILLLDWALALLEGFLFILLERLVWQLLKEFQLSSLWAKVPSLEELP